MAEDSSDFIILKSIDNVATARRTLKAGSVVELNGTSIELRQTIPGGHKVALASVSPGRELVKYGQNIGFAKRDIEAGDWVHTHNVELKEVGRDYGYCEDFKQLEPIQHKGDVFSGFARAKGRAGTRNYIAVISSVNCSATVSRYVADHFRTNDFTGDFSNVDGVVAFTHKAVVAMIPITVMSCCNES